MVRAHLRKLQRCRLVCKTVHGVKTAWEEPGTLQFMLAGVRAAGSRVQMSPAVQGTLQEQRAGGRPG